MQSVYEIRYKDQARQRERNTIRTIAKNNDFPIQLINNLKTRLLEYNIQTITHTNNKEKMDNIHLS
jgi:hypothetical protein